MNIPVTEWFPAEVKPALPGFYEVIRQLRMNTYPSHTMLRFNGDIWVHTDHSSNSQFANSFASMSKGDRWRGLTSPHPEWKP